MTDVVTTKDAWMLQRIGGSSKYGNGDGTLLHVGLIDSGDANPDWKCRTFLEFPLTSALSGLTVVTAATLTLVVGPNTCMIGGRGGTIRIFAEKCTGDFSERVVEAGSCAFESGSSDGVWPGSSITTADRALHSSTTHSTGNSITWDLTAMVEAARAAGDTVLRIRLIAANSGGTAYDEETAARRISFYSLQDSTAGNRPKLAITGTAGSTAINKSDSGHGVDTKSITKTSTGAVITSESAVGVDTLVRAGQIPDWETVLSDSPFDEDEGAGQVTLYNENDETHALLSGVDEEDVLISARFKINKIPDDARATWRIVARALDVNNFYFADIYLKPNKIITLAIGKRVNTVETVLLINADVATLIADKDFLMEFRVLGTTPTAMSARVWRDGTNQPGYQLVVQDSEASLQTDGTIGIGVLAAEGLTNSPLTFTFDNFEAIAPV